MPHKVLLAFVGLREDGQIEAARSAVAENVRQCTYYIQIFEDTWGPQNLFRKMFFLAADCRDDVSLPMREVVACLKAAARETDPEILAFRKELAGQQHVRVLHFDKVDSLTTQLQKVCSGWMRSILKTAETDQPTSGASRAIRKAQALV